MGALGGLVASRIAREFRLGGPSFTVSSEETSGLRALEIAERTLRLPPVFARPSPIDAAPLGSATLSVEYWKAGDALETEHAPAPSTHARELPIPKLTKRGA